MNFIVITWIVWAALALVLLGLLLYHMNITQDEEDDLFLDAGEEAERRRQADVTAKLKRIKPLIRLCGGAEGVATLVLVGFYILDAFRQF